MNAGKLNKRVELQQPSGTQDAYGERVTTWTTVATVWAAIAPVSARETLAQLAGGQVQTELMHRITIRYSATVAAIAADWRVVFGSRVFVLAARPRNPNEANQWLELLCSEGMTSE